MFSSNAGAFDGNNGRSGNSVRPDGIGQGAAAKKTVAGVAKDRRLLGGTKWNPASGIF
jgi:hypothetical protein